MVSLQVTFTFTFSPWAHSSKYHDQVLSGEHLLHNHCLSLSCSFVLVLSTQIVCHRRPSSWADGQETRLIRSGYLANECHWMGPKPSLFAKFALESGEKKVGTEYCDKDLCHGDGFPPLSCWRHLFLARRLYNNILISILPKTIMSRRPLRRYCIC